MELTDWIPAGTLALIVWLARNLIVTRLKAAVQSEFDIKLAEVSADLRKSEEFLKSELRAKDAEISALRDGAMTALVSRQVAVDKRRLEAVDQVWASVTSLNQARAASRFLSHLNFEALARGVKSNPKVQEFLNAPCFQYDPKQLRPDANAARPFVTPMVWAVYSALFSVCTHAPMVADAIRSGLDVDQLIDQAPMQRLVAAALPELADQVAKVKNHGWYDIYIVPLERRLLEELRSMLDGQSLDRERVGQAAKIQAAADDAWQTLHQPETPDGIKKL
jgi:hypothetical protein